MAAQGRRPSRPAGRQAGRVVRDHCLGPPVVGQVRPCGHTAGDLCCWLIRWQLLLWCPPAATAANNGPQEGGGQKRWGERERDGGEGFLIVFHRANCRGLSDRSVERPRFEPWAGQNVLVSKKLKSRFILAALLHC